MNKWRSRHLFKEEVDFGQKPQSTTLLITYGTLLRKSHTLQIGNFNQDLRHTEDGELGQRLLAAGYSLLGYPQLKVFSLVENNLWEVLERYWRWYIGKNEQMNIHDYFHAIKASIKPMAQTDFTQGDWGCIPISLLCPHYCFAKTWLRKLTISR